MALDKLRKDQPQRLCELLSNDPGYIIEECGNLLSVNEYKQIQNQSCALDKMNMLLKIVKQKEETCQSFDAILRKHGGHYQQWWSPAPESPAPTALADNSSVCNARKIRDIRGKSLNMRTEVVNDPASSPSGGFTGPVPKHDYVATGGSIICADKLSNVTVDGDIDLSVTMRSQRRSGGAEDTRPSSQEKWTRSCETEPAVKMIKENKRALIKYLSSDFCFILQHISECNEEIVTDRQYIKLKEMLHSENAMTDLLDLLIRKGQGPCSHFLDVLKKPEVLKTYPGLRKLELGND